MNEWQKATVIRVRQGAEDMRVLTVVPQLPWPHRAGQNYELRLIGGPDARMFSILSPPTEPGELEFGVQLIAGGLVSPGLYALKEGDEIEIRGPHGLLFLWEPAPGPLVLVGGGSGIAPLIPIYEQHQKLYPNDPVVFIMSAKTPAHILDYDKLKNVLVTRFTAQEPRIDQAFLADKIAHLVFIPGVQCFVCGPAMDFIKDMAEHLATIGFSPYNIRTERYY